MKTKIDKVVSIKWIIYIIKSKQNDFNPIKGNYVILFISKFWTLLYFFLSIK